ncbi:unnamed protein product [Linum trigynum]|uniref:Uncharacterized protein n=1 Tax=Linum trigynum TaxID=586398 RepID=A0AAV2GBY6_9ROSI
MQSPGPEALTAPSLCVLRSTTRIADVACVLPARSPHDPAVSKAAAQQTQTAPWSCGSQSDVAQNTPPRCGLIKMVLFL